MKTAGAGFTVIEALVAVALVGIALLGILPSFVTLLDSNTISEERSDSVAAAQLVMEELRRTDPVTMPETGEETRFVQVGSREYEALTTYCTEDGYCSASSRHVVVAIRFGGRTVYRVASVFTRLQ